MCVSLNLTRLVRGGGFGLLLSLAGSGWGAVTLTPLTSARLWRLLEYRVSGLPAAANPFDPDQLRVDGLFGLPSGRQALVPAFWYQGYRRSLADGAEVLTRQGSAEWRLRFTPPEIGPYTLNLVVWTNGQTMGGLVTNTFVVGAGLKGALGGNSPEKPAGSGWAGESSPAGAGGGRSLAPTSVGAGPGYVRVAANQRYFETDQGAPLPLLGACVCWHDRGGTYDYDTWFGSLAGAGGNYARLWMAPWAFGFEAEPGTLTRYRLDRAWQLDYVLSLAERHHLYLMLCLDYHGMFEIEPDYWGGGNYWPHNPYSTAQGGPCTNQNAFFTLPAAQQTYQKRLRYLIARYGYSPNLLAWQFFNELDNVYRYLDATNVAAWHGVMGDWLRANDPFHHLVTTSLTGSSDRPEIWRLPQMDFAMYHSYNLPQPAAGLATVIQSFLTRYQKPMMVGEYGTDWRGWGRTNDPFLRGWRQGIWAAALGGSVGTAMSWYWQNLQSESLYPYYRALADFTGRTAWGRGPGDPVTFQTSGDPPVNVGELIPDGTPFTATLPLNGQWGPRLRGQLALTTPLSAGLAPTVLNAFVHGTGHPELRIACRIDTWLGTNAQLVMHLNSVSDGAILAVYRDGMSLFRRSLPNLDGTYQVNNEYNEDIPVSLPAGRHLIEIRNVGGDWFYLDWVRLVNVLPSRYAGGWEPSPVAVGVRAEKETLLYVVSPQVNFPANATNATIEPLIGASLRVRHLPAGRYQAFWSEPRTAVAVGETTGRSDGVELVLPLPPFTEDLAGRLLTAADFGFTPPLAPAPRRFQTSLYGEPGHHYRVEISDQLTAWTPWLTLTNLAGAVSLEDSSPTNLSRRFYRARLAE